jgi:hypothetical protein
MITSLPQLETPGYWTNEVSGVLQPAVRAYLRGGELSDDHALLLRAYLRQWIGSPVWDANPYATPQERDWLQALRARVDGLHGREAFAQWLADAEAGGIDPL